MHIFKTLRTTIVLAVCGVFLILSASMALLSSGVYRSVAAAADSNFSQRTVLSYIANQVRAADRESSISVGTFGDGDAIFLTDGDYSTILYFYDGYLHELYSEISLGLAPEDGTPILPVESLSFTVENGLLICRVEQTDGSISVIELHAFCGITEVGGV